MRLTFIRSKLFKVAVVLRRWSAQFKECPLTSQTQHQQISASPELNIISFPWAMQISGSKYKKINMTEMLSP
jgi:hypothetical protein